ncbi:hypothetical protein SAMN04515695_2635 [Pseudovibrio sp. Tun.PSC04-5.I4]|nr:hypothetical protein SAMN04515695_2635 [Pseudovibrio sp. Tun.PSC04-5.I4]
MGFGENECWLFGGGEPPHVPFEGTDPFASASTLSIGAVRAFDKNSQATHQNA